MRSRRPLVAGTRGRRAAAGHAWGRSTGREGGGEGGVPPRPAPPPLRLRPFLRAHGGAWGGAWVGGRHSRARGGRWIFWGGGTGSRSWGLLLLRWLPRVPTSGAGSVYGSPRVAQNPVLRPAFIPWNPTRSGWLRVTSGDLCRLSVAVPDLTNQLSR